MVFSNRRKPWAVCLVLQVATICVMFQYVQGEGVTRNSFWQQAVAVATVNKGWVPGFLVLRIEILDKHDNVEQYEETLLDFMSADIDEARVGHYIDPSSLDIVGTSPFEPEFQTEISVHPTGESRRVEGRQCDGYEYVWHREEEVLTGTAWLEQATGIPVKIKFSVHESGRSRFFPKQHVTVIFHSRSYDTWFPQRMIMEIEGGLLTLGRNVRIVLDYEDYRKTE